MIMNKKEELEVKRVYAGIDKNISNKKWQCILSECHENAINSHLLQRHGVLSHIIEKGHCYELNPIDIFKWKKDQYPIEFKRRGLQEAISLPIYCNSHDTELFKPIETGRVDYSCYNNQILLCYRTICAEIRRKEITVEKYNRYTDSEILNRIRPEVIELIPKVLKSTEIAIKDLFVYKKYLEDEITEPTNSFSFIHVSYPIKGLCASATFTIANEEETADFDRTLDCAFCHLIPTDDNTEFIFGYHNNHVNDTIRGFVNGWSGLDKETIGEKLTGLFTLIESWGMSPSLHDKISEDNKKRYFDLLSKSVGSINQNPNVGFNMFSGLL